MNIPPSLRGELVFSNNDTTRAMPDIHPTKPWILTTAEENNVVIWDYDKKAKIAEFSVNQLDEKQIDNKGQRIADTATKVEKTGQIRYLRFFDRDTRLWKSILSKPITKEKKDDKKKDIVKVEEDFTSPIIDKALCDTAGEFNYVIIVAEYRVIFLDYVTHKVQEIKLSALENKPQSCVDCFGKGSSVIFGGILALF